MKKGEVLSWRALGRATLARQLLLARERVDVVAAVEKLLAVQAQWPKPPFVGLWSRIEGLTREAVIEKLHARELVRATAMRVTIHLMSARDFATLRPCLQGSLDRGMRSVLKGRAETLDLTWLRDTALAYLSAEGPRDFEQIRDHLAKLDPKSDVRAMGYAVRTQLPLVQVPERGAAWGFAQQAAFAPAEAWLGKQGLRASSDRELVRRYLASYGPASAADVQAWTGLPTARTALEALRPKLRTFVDEKGKELFDVPDGALPSPDEPAPVRLLPEFDGAIVARADERILAAANRARVFLPGLRIAPVVLVDGAAAATWGVTRKGDSATLEVVPFGMIGASDRAEIEREATELLAFIEPDAGKRAVRIAKAR